MAEYRSKITQHKQAVLQGALLSKPEAMELIEAPLDELCAAANEIREFFCGNNLICAPLLTEKVVSVPKIANIVPNQFGIQPQHNLIRCFLKRSWWSRPIIMTAKEFPVIPL